MKFQVITLDGESIEFEFELCEFSMSGDSDVCYISDVPCNYDIDMLAQLTPKLISDVDKLKIELANEIMKPSGRKYLKLQEFIDGINKLEAK
jgi:hypothetical protein